MHHLVQNQPKLVAVNQAQSLKTISIVAKILVSTWACMLKKKKKNPHKHFKHHNPTRSHGLGPF